MKPKFTHAFMAIFFIALAIIAFNCNKTSTTTIDDVVKNFYSSINKGDYAKINSQYISGWETRQDSEKQMIEEFQGEIKKIFDQHQGLKEVKIIKNTPGENEAEATLDIQLLCGDGYTEAITLNMIQENEVWKVKE